MRTLRVTIAAVLMTSMVCALTACAPFLGGGGSSRDELVAEIDQVLTDSGEFDAVDVAKMNLTSGWDMDVAVTTDASLTGDELDLMLRTVGARLEGSDVSTVTLLHTFPDTVLGDNIHSAARDVGLVDKLTRNGQALTLWRDEVIDYANSD